jgi:hypothetical protein
MPTNMPLSLLLSIHQRHNGWLYVVTCLLHCGLIVSPNSLAVTWSPSQGIVTVVLWLLMWCAEGCPEPCVSVTEPMIQGRIPSKGNASQISTGGGGFHYRPRHRLSRLRFFAVLHREVSRYLHSTMTRTPVPDYMTEMYASCEVRTEFIYVM